MPTKEIKIYGNQDINNLIDYFKDVFNLSLLDESVKMNRRYAQLMLKKCGRIEVAKLVIYLASQDDFYNNKITSFQRLYYRMVEIVQKAKSKQRTSLKLR